jgi:hypothetical protein
MMKNKCVPFSPVKWFFGLVLLAFLGTELNKAYWDSKVRAMCEKDGGVMVFDRVQISKAAFPKIKLTSKKMLILPFEDQARSDNPFFLRTHSEFLHKGFINVMRHEQSIVRREDGKVLSTHISYGRSGGDLPIGFHPSHYSCGSDEVSLELLKSVITIKGK